MPKGVGYPVDDPKSGFPFRKKKGKGKGKKMSAADQGKALRSAGPPPTKGERARYGG